MNKYKAILTLLLLLSILSACFHEKEVETPVFEVPDTQQSRKLSILHKPESCDDFKSYLALNLIEQYLDNKGGGWGWCPNCIGLEVSEDGVFGPETGAATSTDTSFNTGTAGGSAGTAADASTSNPGSVSGTNVQEAGVDELDAVKTDENGNIFIAQDSNLIIADAFPPEQINELSRLDLENHIVGIFLDEENKRIIAITRYWEEVDNNSNNYSDYYGYYSEPLVAVNIIDISDLSAPTVSSTVKYNGNYESSRFINQRLHLVLNHWLYNIEETFATRRFYEDLERYRTLKFLDLDSTRADEEALREKLAQMILRGVNSLNIEEIFPYYQKDDAEQAALLQCTDVYHPEVSLRSAGMLSVISLDSDGTNMDVSSILSSGGMVYASLNAIYVVQNSHGWWWVNDDQQTVIHKFDLDETGTAYKASGSINGNVNNTFSLSEHANNLRVATTETLWPEDATTFTRHNNLFILSESEDATTELEIIGSFTEFAPDERIFSARFLGERGFVVTFRQTDPVFAFDLSDPTNPILKSELKIPGFSTYMHPIDENHLLTIGRAATDEGRVEETQLQIFDVSDMTNIQKTFDHIPELLQNNSGYGYSVAEHDHHAFTYSSENSILAIPLSYYNWQENDSFSGIATFKIDVTNGISENGVVDHSSFIDTSECSTPVEGENSSSGSSTTSSNDTIAVIDDSSCLEKRYSHYAQPNRSIVMIDQDGENNYLYSISRIGIKANDLLNMENELGALNISDSD